MPNIGSRPIRSASLLGLPLEIRREIYRPLLCKQQPIHLLSHSYSTYEGFDELLNWLNVQDIDREEPGPMGITSVFLISKGISEEALDMFYGENFFMIIFNEGESQIIDEFPSANRQRLRRLEFILRPMGDHYGLRLNLDSKIWVPLLGQLTRLRIVAQQPLRSLYDFEDFQENAIHEWTSWLKPVLEYINENTSTQIILEIDDDGRSETSELIKKTITKRYRKVQCSSGDWCFKRGDFTSESDFDYWYNDDQIDCGYIVDDADYEYYYGFSD